MDAQSTVSAQRDLTAEANVIKQALTKPEEVKKDIRFSSTIDTVIDGFSIFKIGQQNKTRFVPDFYFAGDLIMRCFQAIRNDKALKKNDDFCPYGFLLYCYYGMFYHLIKVINERNSSFVALRHVQTAFENAGFIDFNMPMFLFQWFESIGIFTNPYTGRVFEPHLPPINNLGDGYNNYFWNIHFGHFLPNFRTIIMKALYLSKHNYLGIAGLRRVDIYRDRTQLLNNPNLLGIVHARANDHRIPGCSLLDRQQVSEELADILNGMLNVQQPDVYLRYLNFDDNLLRYLRMVYNPIIEHMDHFNGAKVSTQGTALQMCFMREELNMEILDPEIFPPVQVIPPPQAGVQQPPVPQIPVTYSNPNRAFKIVSQFKVIDGNASIASVLPVVRIPSENTAIMIDNQPQLPNIDGYFNRFLEYQSARFTLSEAHARFQRI